MMREFFKGWRRKVGCVTLVVACVVAIAWGRSVRVRDTVEFGFNGSSHYVFISDGRIEWSRWWYRDGRQPNKTLTWISGPEFIPPWMLIPERVPPASTWAIPYWSLVIPLTLLSAYLLLWKTRKRTEPDHA